MSRTLEILRLDSPRVTRPSSVPYVIDLPLNIQQEIDEKCASYWLPGCDVALQITSYPRTEGSQISARRRLAARLSRGGGSSAHPLALGIGHCDCAASSLIDNDGNEWLHVYLVWRDLAIYATVSGRPLAIAGREGQWALEALRSIRPLQRAAGRPAKQRVPHAPAAAAGDPDATARYEAPTLDEDLTPTILTPEGPGRRSPRGAS